MQPINMPVPSPDPTVAVAAGANSGSTSQLQVPGTVFQSQVRDTTGASGGSASGVYNSGEFSNRNARGARFYITNSGAATGNMAFQVQVAAPGQYPSTTGPNWINLTGATLSVNGTGGEQILTVYPGLTGIADASGINNQHLGLRWRGQITMTNASGTCAVYADYLF